MPGEVFVIIIVAIVMTTVMVTSIVKHTMEYLSGKSKSKHDESSLTSSELQALMQEAVTRATQPLMDQVKELERRLEASSQNTPLLEEKSSTSAQKKELESTGHRPE